MSDLSQRYSTAAARFTAVVEAVPADRWDAPSPCDGWSARDLVEHIVSTETDFLTQRGIEVPTPDEDDPVSSWPATRNRVQTVLDDPALAGVVYDGWFGPNTIGAAIDRFFTVDLLVHRWDLAMAVGLADHAELDAEEISFLRAHVDSYPAEVMRMPGIFGPEVAAPDDADATTRLMAFLGRSV